MITTDIKKAELYALEISASCVTEFICKNCDKSFFFVNENKNWENYGVFLHTKCPECGFMKEYIGPGFKQIEHKITAIT
jgi:hypothetical protein